MMYLRGIYIKNGQIKQTRGFRAYSVVFFAAFCSFVGSVVDVLMKIV